ncbi:MAG: hypothetical protein ACI8ZM_005197 [Crocinitomix sp.]|jgi:hypothetical protein
MRNLHLFLLLFLIGNVGFSQAGTYTIDVTPSEGFELFKDENGRMTIPPLIVGTATIKLKNNKSVLIIHNKNEADEFRESGTWAQSEKPNIINISIVYETETVILEFEILTYESGIYLKPVDRIIFYKKK